MKSLTLLLKLDMFLLLTFCVQRGIILYVSVVLSQFPWTQGRFSEVPTVL